MRNEPQFYVFIMYRAKTVKNSSKTNLIGGACHINDSYINFWGKRSIKCTKASVQTVLLESVFPSIHLKCPLVKDGLKQMKARKCEKAEICSHAIHKVPS